MPDQIIVTLDTEALALRRARARAEAKATYQDVTALGRIVRALALVTLDEINILRQLHGLAPRTAAQLRTAIETKVDADA